MATNQLIEDLGLELNAHELRRRGTAAPRARLLSASLLEALAIALISGIAFGVLGYWLLTTAHVIVPDSVDALTRAFMVWHDSPPKLAAIGFSTPPLQSVAYLVFALIKPMATSFVALPLMSATFGAAVMTLINRGLTDAQMSPLQRYPLLILVAANPLFAFYAANGRAEMVYLFLIGGAVAAFVAWLVTEGSRYLVVSAITVSLAMLTRYEFIAWGAVMGLFVGITLLRRRASQDKLESMTIGFLTPSFYVLGLWAVFDLVIEGTPFGWLKTAGTPLGSSLGNAHAGVGVVATHLLRIVLAGAPIAFVVVPALLYVFLTQRDVAALWLATLTALPIVIYAVDALTQNQLSVLTLNDGLAVLVPALCGAAWLYRQFEDARAAIWVVSVIALAAGLPLAWQQMRTYPYQDQEQAFVRALSNGQDQTGNSSLGGYTVGVAAEREMAAYINTSLHASRHQILVDNTQSFGVILLSDHPGEFLDRIDRGDTRWRSILASPYGQVSYMLVDYGAPSDLIFQRYPGIATGTDPRFSVLFRDGDYALVSVPATQPQVQVVTPGAGVDNGGLFTPSSPATPSNQSVDPNSTTTNPNSNPAGVSGVAGSGLLNTPTTGSGQ